MPTLSIKHVPESVVDQLRKRAALNHRSMQGELMALICGAVGAEPERRPRSREGGLRAPGHVSIEQIASEHRTRWLEPFHGAPPAVDLIRSDRDAG